MADVSGRRFSFSDFSTVIEQEGKDAVQHPGTLIGSSGPYCVFYTPFEYVERRARLMIVGITPGTTQIALAYDKAKDLLRAGTPDADILRDVKAYAAFGGVMRTRLIKMLHHFDFASLLGLQREEELWGSAAHLLHSTSVVPHAAFKNDEMFKGTFDEILLSSALRESFENHFVPDLALLQPETVFVALGDTPLAALDHCVGRGLISRNQVLGAFAHPSGSGGSQVDVYLGERSPASLLAKDPVRHRVPRLLDNAARMRSEVARFRQLLGGAAVLAAAPIALTAQTSARKNVAAVPRSKRPAANSAIQKSSSQIASNDRLHFVVARGKSSGRTLHPHVHADGCYVVSPTRFERDYIRVHADQPLEDFLRRGLRLRMSAPGVAPSLIIPDSIRGR